MLNVWPMAWGQLTDGRCTNGDVLGPGVPPLCRGCANSWNASCAGDRRMADRRYRVGEQPPGDRTVVRPLVVVLGRRRGTRRRSSVQPPQDE